MFKKRILTDKCDHIIIYSDEPIRIEIIGEFVLHGYKGTKTDMLQKPHIFHDTDFIV